MTTPKNRNTSAYYVIDFDRTLGNTDKFHAVLEEIITRETSISKEELISAKKVAEGRGESFDTIGYVKEAVALLEGGFEWQPIQRAFIEEAQKQDMLEPDAEQLLRILNERHLPYGIVTYGGEQWQLAKLEAAKLLEVPHIVTHIQEKGTILAGWCKRGGFIIPPTLTKDFTPLIVQSVVFLDDKAVSFKNLPEGVRGVRVISRASQLPSQFGELPEGVTDVWGLRGAIELLFPDLPSPIVDKP